MIYKNFSQKDFIEAEKAYDKCGKHANRPILSKNTKQLSRGQFTALFIAMIVFIYSIISFDIPACFFSIAFLIWIMQYYTHKFSKSHAVFLRSMLKSLSMTLFIGSIILMLI
ncbi:hypothetical protein [Pectinatus sottacetonis]|uniref:hypothetical protein n=1 Tax=Pectinatus sottacetonis TaxID=1002795 RepID=UPI0018C79EA9|nr:hypothetical protein [Pectinatus sottacetonis]